MQQNVIQSFHIPMTGFRMWLKWSYKDRIYFPNLNK